MNIDSVAQLLRDNYGWLSFVGCSFVLGMLAPMLVRFLRADAAAKLKDTDPKNDGFARAEGALADTIEEKVKQGTVGQFLALLFKKK